MNLGSDTGAAREYQARIIQFESERKDLERASNRIVAGRLVVFALMGFGVYLSVKYKSTLLMILPLLLVAVFLHLVRKAVGIRRKIQHIQELIRINQDEIRSLGGDYSAFDPGTDFIDYQHEYSFDLDIFGEHSLYRLLNRVATPLGKETLANRLLYPGTNSTLIRSRQEAVRELENKLNWRQDFLATARESDWKQQPEPHIKSWLNAPDRFSKNRFYRIAILVNSIISLIILIISLLPSLNSTVFSFLGLNALPSSSLTYYLYFLIPIALIISRTRIINREQQKLDRLLELFRKYGGLLHLIEQESFESPLLIKLKSSLEHGDIPASKILKKLTGILWGLEVRGNLIVSFLLNALFLWDILVMIRLEKWRHSYGEAFGDWIRTIAEMETLNSLANLAYNRSDLTWPEIRDGVFSMEMENGGHPLIDPAKRVDNSLSFEEGGRIYLITGANMAGKSTLLRMVGVNMILAMTGGPVCASRLALVPVSIHTSVRTNDSLGDDESYFYAELKKLSRIIKRFEEGEKLFVIIDEMLKGTNSRDKHTGSAALIHQLTALGASGLVATHDVELGELAEQYPGRLLNGCFEVITVGNLLKFDYLLYPGVSKNLNATFLMKQMGIIRQ